MKTTAKELDTRFVAEIIKAEGVVFEAIVLDEVDKYRKMV